MVYVTSDLHGYPLEDFQALLAKAGFSDEDFCFVLGDVIDRGPDGIKLLEWMMLQPNMELLLGNHEALLLACDFLFEPVTEDSVEALTEDQLELLSVWLDSGGTPTVDALRRIGTERVKAIVDYLRDAPLYEITTVGGRDFLLVHSGLENFDPKRPLSSYDADELLWCRPQLTDRYFNKAITVFGHTPTGLFGREYTGRLVKTDTWLCIDTGASSGLHPMLLRLDDLREFYADNG